MIVKRSKPTWAGCALLVLVTSGCAWVQRASVSSSGAEGDNFSLVPAISADGRYVAFESTASNLVAGDTNGQSDVFLRDTLAGTTSRVSVNSSGNQGQGFSRDAAISADGRYVAFYSESTNLVAGDTKNQWDVFVRDTVAGTTSRVSVSSSGNQGNGFSLEPSISADGRYVAFESAASNLVAGDTNDGYDVFVRDTVAGTTSRVSVNSSEKQVIGTSVTPAISGNGAYVAFVSDSSTLVAGDTNDTADIFVRDILAGTTTRANVDSNETQGNAGADSSEPAISADGRYVAFTSLASNLVPGDTNAYDDAFVRDTVAGTTSRVSVDSSAAQGNGETQWPSISGDGRYVAFYSSATNLVAGDTNNADDVFVRDTLSGTTSRASVNFGGAQGNDISYMPAISRDGRYVAYTSLASNLVGGDTNAGLDVIVRAIPQPSVVAIEPATVARGTTTPVAVTGSGFIDGAVLTVQGGGVTVANVTIVGPNQIVADVTVAADAPTGARSVWVTLSGTGPGPDASSSGVCNKCLAVSG